jgi:hypothetical protein
MISFDHIQIVFFQSSFLLRSDLMSDSHHVQINAPYFEANDSAIRVIGQPQSLNSILAHEFAERATRDTVDLGSE